MEPTGVCLHSKSRKSRYTAEDEVQRGENIRGAIEKEKGIPTSDSLIPARGTGEGRGGARYSP